MEIQKKVKDTGNKVEDKVGSKVEDIKSSATDNKNKVENKVNDIKSSITGDNKEDKKEEIQNTK